MSASIEAIELLRSIDTSLKTITAYIQRVSDIAVNGLKAASVNDSLCDGPHGDPVVRQKPPRDWSGEDMKGRRFSECPAEFLDLYAARLDHFAAQKDASDPEQARKQKFEMLDASRARSWAARLRGGWTAPTQAPAQDAGEPQW